MPVFEVVPVKEEKKLLRSKTTWILPSLLRLDHCKRRIMVGDAVGRNGKWLA